MKIWRICRGGDRLKEKVYLEFRKVVNGVKLGTEIMGQNFEYGERVEPSVLGLTIQAGPLHYWLSREERPWPPLGVSSRLRVTLPAPRRIYTA